MSNWPAPSRAHHKRFVEIEGWELVRNATGSTGHHWVYRLEVHDEVLRTRISHPPTGKKTYGRGMWTHILRDQLAVTEAEFWACVNDGVLPERSRTQEPPSQLIPVGVVEALLAQVGLSERQVRAMTREEAIRRLNEFWAEGT